MYYVAFFTGNHVQITEKLSSFLAGDLEDVGILYRQQAKCFQSLNDVPIHSGYWYSHAWCIHGQILQSSQNKFLKIPVYTSPQFTTSFEDIDVALAQLAMEYKWTVFPWGGAGRFTAFGFLSSDRSLCEQFIDASSVSQEIDCADAHPSSLISHYRVDTTLSECIHAILFRGYYQPAYRLWNVCGCNAELPWLVTDFQLDEETFSIFGWEPAHYDIVQSLTLTEDQVLFVYQTLDQASFESICKLSMQEPDTLIWVHPSINLQELENLLRETEAYDSNSDLKHLQNILGTTEWFYGIDRDRVDYGDSLFVARSSLLLNKFDQISVSDDYRLISCF